MFIDEVIVELYAGDGGNGCLAFRREKYVEMGGPFGGNGGKGADIIFEVDEGINTLLDLRYKKIIKGKRGENGLGKGCHGKKAENIIVKVPPGTIITDTETNLIVADLTNHKESVVIVEGGRGGRGNMAFATHANPAPDVAENGEPGDYRKIKVELKLLADVGLVGLPSVGKSTIISKISRARPKIAEYHFTTLVPNLGVVRSNSNTFVVADLPGLIEGASLGHGLGDKFLKHIERTRMIAHVVDMSGQEGRDPYEDYVLINKELEEFSDKMLKKPQIIIANKMDHEAAKENLEEFKKKVDLDVFEISAINNEGLDEVIQELGARLEKIEKEPLFEEEVFESHVIYKFKDEKPFTIEKDHDVYIIKGKEIEKMFRMTRFDTEESIMRFSRKLRKLGVEDELRKAGAEEGDSIQILNFLFEFKF